MKEEWKLINIASITEEVTAKREVGCFHLHSVCLFVFYRKS